MAESVDALVSNTSGATRAGSTPALGTRQGWRIAETFGSAFFFMSVLYPGGPYQDVLPEAVCRCEEINIAAFCQTKFLA